MAKPIYAGSYNTRRGGRWKSVFIVIVLIQIVVVAAFLIYSKKNKGEEQPESASVEPGIAAPAAPALPDPELAPVAADVPVSPEVQASIADARSALLAGQLPEAKAKLDEIVATAPNPEAIQLLGEVNMKMLKSPIMMPGKEYYSIQSGDYLQKIARNFNTTVPLIKTMNGMQTDTILANARLLVFNGNFSIRVSKTRNTLDLLSNGRLFKRYSVGTGKFGKTPAVEFKIVDKIVEPPWTRPTDNKQIEYGDPENVLGTRWMKIVSEEHPEITGFGIHGTWERNSIGSQSSAGCIRMLNEDVEELFDLVPRGTSVIITE